MALTKLVTCDLCGTKITPAGAGPVLNGKTPLANRVVRVGARDWRDEDFHRFDVCPACEQHGTMAGLMAVFAAADEGMVH